MYNKIDKNNYTVSLFQEETVKKKIEIPSETNRKTYFTSH